jgi:cytochrome P450
MTAASEAAPRDVPTMPGGHLLLGHALEFGRDPLALFQRAREHGDVVRIRFGPFRVYVLNSPGAIRQALVGEARRLSKGLNFGRAKRLIGGGLVMAEGDGHQRQRRLMQPAFHRSEIARYTGTMRDVAVPRINGWPDGGTLAFDREMRSITLTVLTRTLLSTDIGADAIDEIEQLLRVLLSELVTQGISANVPGLAWVPTRSNRRFSAANRRLRALLTDVIDGYRNRGAGAGETADREEHGDLISILMRARDDDTGAGMTNEQLRDEATTLVIAGSETTGNTLAWACYLLAQHPQIQARLQAEADLVLAGADADYETLSRLPFTRAVITETLRLYSPVWILPRRALVDVELDGYLLPAGSRMFFSPYALNRDTRLHRDPDCFDPDRWGTDYSRSDLRATFFPFGQGIRNCIGEGFAWTESILLLSAIAARWQLRLADGADVHPVVSSTLVPSELPIIVTRRAG